MSLAGVQASECERRTFYVVFSYLLYALEECMKTVGEESRMRKVNTV